MMLSDPVAIALITGITGVVTSVANLVVQLLTKRNVKRLKETVKQQHAETRQSLSEACKHPLADVPLRSPTARTRRND
jgi:hypothetical protein